MAATSPPLSELALISTPCEREEWARLVKQTEELASRPDVSAADATATEHPHRGKHFAPAGHKGTSWHQGTSEVAGERPAQETQAVVTGGNQTTRDPKVEAMVSIPYTVEPGFHACNRYLSGRQVGGIGALNQVDKLHDYEGYEEYPGLSEFLDLLTYVDGEYPSYYVTSAEDVNYYFVSYIMRFLEITGSISCVSLFVDAFRNNVAAYDPRQFGYHIVMGEPFFNFVFYQLSYMMALELLDRGRMEACLEDLGPSNLTGKQRLVNEFDHFKRCAFVFDAPDGSFRSEHRESAVEERLYGPVYHCSEHDFNRYWKPYVLFLSNFSIILAVALAVNLFGECTFTLGWEYGRFARDLPRERWPHPRK